jgi:hypothetical protein
LLALLSTLSLSTSLAVRMVRGHVS